MPRSIQAAIDAVDQVNGHTSAVARKYYLKRDREDDAKRCIHIASTSPGTHKENDGDRLPQRLQNGELIAPSPVSSVKWTKLPWGTAHPFYNKDTIRVGITEKELNYIDDLTDSLTDSDSD